jgi:phage terminase large subunit-like protein
VLKRYLSGTCAFFFRYAMYEAEIIVVAAARDQADQLRHQAEKLVRRSGKQVGTFFWKIGDDIYKVSSREIRYGTTGRLRVLAADAATGDGAIPTLALVDELHRHRSLDLYGVLADGLEAPAPKGWGGNLKDFERFCLQLKLDTGKPLKIEPHEREILRLYFRGFTEIVVLLSKKNGKTTILAALGLYHLKVGCKIRQMITISTAGAKKDSPLGALRERAHRMPTFRRKGVKNTAMTEDKSFAWLEWCLTDEDDRTDFKLVKKANPASWHTVESLRRRYKRPDMTPGRWARFACGVWTEGEEPWIEPQEWDRLRVDIGQLQEGESVWVAVCTGINPAYALVAERDDGGVAVKVRVFEGDPTLGLLKNEVLALTEIYDVESITWGQTAFGRPAEELEEMGLSVREFAYKAPRLSAASPALKQLIQEKKLRHDGDPELRAQVMAGSTKSTEEGWRLVPTDQSRGLIALTVACYQATESNDSEPLIVVGSVG